MNAFLDSIKKPQKHVEYPLLKNYDFGSLSKELGISISYFRNCLCGHAFPSKKLDERIHALAAKIRNAEANAAEGAH
ncbi:MAG: hypothetical protein HQK65_13355 [Desulfamplus sp.]|nr:hypothetical protein [Desulfamplus sp.]